MTPAEELLGISDRLTELVKRSEDVAIAEPISKLQEAANKIGQAWSGSWLGYQANVYYENFVPPPAGAAFSIEWGFKEIFGDDGTRGNWLRYNASEVIECIKRAAGDPSLDEAEEFANSLRRHFSSSRSEVLSILSIELERKSDPYLQATLATVENLKIFSKDQFIQAATPNRQVISRDSLAIGRGFHAPAHYTILGAILALRNPTEVTAELAELARKIGTHITRSRKIQKKMGTVGTNVFIGHGQSVLWRDLKDWIQDRMNLPWDEFNRVPVAGITNIARLSEMLDASTVAFLVMTGEDEIQGGKLQARMNVIHEAGLFQGRLGFTRAILLLEEGCEEFSNIQGLGQIRFPKGNIKAAFEEIRQVLEREEVISH